MQQTKHGVPLYPPDIAGPQMGVERVGGRSVFHLDQLAIWMTPGRFER